MSSGLVFKLKTSVIIGESRPSMNFENRFLYINLFGLKILIYIS